MMNTQTTSMEKLLRAELEQLRSSGKALSAWIDKNFTQEVITTVTSRGEENSSLAQKDGKEHGFALAMKPLFFQISTLPFDLEKAKAWLAKNYKGYPGLLERSMNSWLFKGSGSTAFCQIIFGRTEAGQWLKMSLIPLGKAAKEFQPVLPKDLLSEKEEKRIAKAIKVARKKMKKLPPPLSWVRLKVVAALALICGGLYYLGLNPLAQHEINSLGAGKDGGTRFSVGQVGLGLLEGRSSFDAFKLATPPPQNKAGQPAAAAGQKGPGEKEKVASADQIVCDLGMDDFLRKRFAMDEVSITKPLLRLERRADGTINVGEIGSKGPEEPSGKPTDWVKAVEDWAQKIKKRIEDRKKQEQENKGKPKAGKEKGAQADYNLQVAYPYENLPGAVVRKVMAKALEIQFDDQTGAVKPPPIKNGTLEITNLSDKPEVMEQPIGISLSGEIEGGKIAITGTIDLRRIAEGNLVTEKNLFLFNVKATGVPLAKVVQAFAGDSLNAAFEKGTADLDAEIRLDHLDALLIHAPKAGSPLFSLHGVEMKAKPGSKIAGFDGDQFANAVNEVGDLDISDLEIGGTLTSPEFKWGDSIKELVVSGGKAFAKKQAQKGVEKGTEEAQKLLEKQLKSQSPEVKKTLEKVLPGGLDVKKSVGGALGNLLGTKKTEPPPPPPPEEKK